MVGLDLAIRYPQQVHTLIAHEPPVPVLLSDAWRRKAARMQKDLLATARREGAAVAIQQFARSLGVQRADLQGSSGLPRGGGMPAAIGEGLTSQAENARMAEKNRAAFFRYDTRAVASYRLDLPALKAAPTRILPAGGQASRGTWPFQCAAALAEALGVDLVEFPGDHAGFSNHPNEFAGRLREVFSNY